MKTSMKRVIVTGWEQAWSDAIVRRLHEVIGERVDLIDADLVHAELRTELRQKSRRNRVRAL
jgi:hypothetical protein